MAAFMVLLVLDLAGFKVGKHPICCLLLLVQWSAHQHQTGATWLV